MIKSRRLIVLAGLPLAIACGGTAPKAATPPAPVEADAAPSAPAESAAPTASAPAPSAPASSAPASSAAPPAPETPPAKPPVVIGETKDECTPVGIDFEKRARPKLKECYAEGKKKAPSLEGTVKVKVTVDVKGKIKSTKIIEKTLPDPVADCMLKVIKSTPFPEVDKCWDASLTIPITFPTPK